MVFNMDQKSEIGIQVLRSRKASWVLAPGILIAALLQCMVAVSMSYAEVLLYKDKLGREVSIQTPVKRAVFFETYELIPALDIWDKAVGISRYAYGNDLMTAAKPDIKKSIPSAGSGFDVNMEALLKLNPEIVITWTSNPQNIRFMEEKGLAVYAIYPEGLDELYEVMRFHGKIFDREKRVEAVKDRRVFKAPEWSTWSPRLAPIALWMAVRTYPEQFRDVQIEKEADIFYRSVFGVEFNKVKGFA